MSIIDSSEFIVVVASGSDDTLEIQNAINIANGKTVVLEGTYNISSPITGKDVKILSKNAHIKTSYNGEAFSFRGESRGLYTATSGYTSGRSYILMPNTVGIEKGDIIRVASSTDLFHPSRSYYYKGGNFEITKVESDRVWINGAMPFNISEINIVEVNNPATVKMEGRLRIENISPLPNGLFGIKVDYGKNIHIEDVAIDNFETCLTVRFCVNAYIKSVSTERAFYVGTGTSYGLATISSTNVLYENCNTQSGRHGHASGGYEPVMNLSFVNCQIFNEPSVDNTATSMDTHDNIVNVSMVNCEMDAFTLAGNVTMLNCTVHHREKAISSFTSQDSVYKANYILDGITFSNGGIVRLSGYSQSGGTWTMNKIGSFVARNWVAPVSMNLQFRAKTSHVSMPLQYIDNVLVENCTNLQILFDDNIKNLAVKNCTYNFDAVFVYQYSGTVGNVLIENCTIPARYTAINLIGFKACTIANCSDISVGNTSPRINISSASGVLTMINNALTNMTQGLQVNVSKYALINTNIALYGTPVGTKVVL